MPGKPVVGIEIPNGATALVTLREILESPPYARMASPLKIALGKDVAGKPVVAGLAKRLYCRHSPCTGHASIIMVEYD